MFTGIISGVGRIVLAQALGADASHGQQLTIETPAGFLDDVRAGDSIALNGACMTVTAFDAQAARFTIDMSAESLARTAGWQLQAPVNLEKALAAHERLGGHLVTGHVDALGRVSRIRDVGESWELLVLAPSELARFIAVKGSITVNGVSLTVNRVSDVPQGCELSINIIPHTQRHTMLGTLVEGASVNLEIDLIARYVERMLGLAAGPSASG